MAAGGGLFITQNKILPGSYVRFKATISPSATVSDRGIVAVPLMLDWGPNGVFELTASEFTTQANKIFGCGYDDPSLAPLREVFCYAKSGYFYRLNSGEQAANDYATAKCSGTLGNSINIEITKNVDDESLFDVVTWLSGSKVDEQAVTAASNLVDNDYVVFKKNASLAETALGGLALSGGTNGTVDAAQHSAFLDAIGGYAFDILCCPSSTDAIKQLYTTYTKSMIADYGSYFQCVVYDYSKADHEGIINVRSTITDAGAEEYSLVWWVAGASAGCNLGKSLTNRTYNGEFAIDATNKPAQNIQAIKDGEFIFYKDGSVFRVLNDLSSLVTFTVEKGSLFSKNETVRTNYTIVKDISALFNSKYLGNVLNISANRALFWTDLCEYFKKLEDTGAIQDFEPDRLTVEEGDTKNAVVVTVVINNAGTMEILYLTVVNE